MQFEHVGRPDVLQRYLFKGADGLNGRDQRNQRPLVYLLIPQSPSMDSGGF